MPVQRPDAVDHQCVGTAAQRDPAGHRVRAAAVLGHLPDLALAHTRATQLRSVVNAVLVIT